jgi:transketolase
MGYHAELINIHTIKPLDEDAIIKSVGKTGCLVSAEEHQINGGLGDSIAQLLSKTNPTPQEFVAVNDEFGQSGKPEELLSLYKLDAAAIIQASLRAIERKKKS